MQKAFLEVQKEFGSFDKYVWKFVANKPLKSALKHLVTTLLKQRRQKHE